MSDYLSRVIERSLGLAPKIEPLIAPIHAPSGQMLSETVETSATFESSPPAKIESPQQDAPSGVAVKARAAEPAFSQMGSQPAPPSTPLPESRAEFPAEKKDDRPDPIESRPKVRSRQTFSTSRPEVVEITGASPPATRMVSKEKNQIVFQPEVVKHVDPATTPAASSPQLSPNGPSAIQVSRLAPSASRPETSLPTPRPSLVTTETVSKEKNRIVVQPEIISPLKPAADPAVSLVQPLPKEPPAIHVTIGRVEVRAVMPSVAAPKRAAPSVPKLSLENYLEQRNGGRP